MTAKKASSHNISSVHWL